MRSGDLLSSGLVFAGSMIALDAKGFARVNLVLVVVWIAIVVLIAREHRKVESGEVKA